jgi:hypothetical protein
MRMIDVIFWEGSTWPDGYVGDTGYVKYYASWNGQYHAIQEPVTRAFGRVYKSGLARLM